MACTQPNPSQTGQPMGMRFGLEDSTTIIKRKFRWLFQIRPISAVEPSLGQTNALPPRRGARPSLSWKEFEFQHLNESIHYPFKPEWKPVQLQLYDINCNQNPVFDWIRYTQQPGMLLQGGMYDPGMGGCNFKRLGTLLMLDGCGNTIEHWTFENCYPQNIEWGELDMDSNDLVTVDLTLRYDRAYIGPFAQDAQPLPSPGNGSGSGGGLLPIPPNLGRVLVPNQITIPGNFLAS